MRNFRCTLLYMIVEQDTDKLMLYCTSISTITSTEISIWFVYWLRVVSAVSIGNRSGMSQATCRTYGFPQP